MRAPVQLAFPLLVTMFLARSTKAFLRPLRVPGAAATTPTPLTVRHLSAVEIAPPEEVLKLFEKPNSVILDVRSQGEIDSQGYIQTNDKRLWIRENCTPAECPTLAETAEANFPVKSSTFLVMHVLDGKIIALFC